MNNKVKLTIRGSIYYINTDESVEYTEELGKKIDQRLSDLLDSGARISVNQATVLVALEMADALSKTLDQVESLRGQMKGYLEDSAKAKSDRDYYKRELERLKTESKFKEDQINLFAKANNNDED